MPTQIELLNEARKFAKEESAAKILRKIGVKADVEFLPIRPGGFFKISVAIRATQFAVRELGRELCASATLKGILMGWPSEIEAAVAKNNERKARRR